MKTNNGLLALLFCLFSISLTGQGNLQFGFSGGVSTYFGDLAPYHIRGSFKDASPATGLFVGYAFSDKLSINLQYTNTELKGDDRYSHNDLRKMRNLHFRSPIHEVGLLAEVHFMQFVNSKHRIFDPYISFGVNLFHFNPQANYNGNWYDLQPLGTEGQGIDELNENDKYNLTQINIPVGLGLKYNMSDNFWVGISASMRFTFTDYLDDVSTRYVDPKMLMKHNGAMSYEMAYRTDEILGVDQSYPTGYIRGHEQNNDNYMIYSVSIGFRLTEISLFNNRWKEPSYGCNF